MEDLSRCEKIVGLHVDHGSDFDRLRHLQAHSRRRNVGYESLQPLTTVVAEGGE